MVVSVVAVRRKLLELGNWEAISPDDAILSPEIRAIT